MFIINNLQIFRDRRKSQTVLTPGPSPANLSSRNKA